MKIENLGHGKFLATNGVDQLTAEYTRGKRRPDGQYRPHWNFTYFCLKSAFLSGTIRLIIMFGVEMMNEDKQHDVEQNPSSVGADSTIGRISLDELLAEIRLS